MATEAEMEVYSFIARDGNESFSHLERECPSCHTDRKTLAPCCNSDSPEDRAAAWCVCESCPDCKIAMVILAC
jgi:hypothetical protein